MGRGINSLWKTGFTIVGLSLVGSSPAAADWQYTKWGMTPEEVVAASAGAARQTTPSEDDGSDGVVTLAMADYVASGFEFSAHFAFSRKDRRLAEITLLLDEPSQCFELKGALERRYGSPTSARGGLLAVTSWFPQSATDAVELHAFGDSEVLFCHLIYKPRLNSDSGL